MKIGIPREIKNNERRVSLTPSGVKSLVSCGHSVMVERDAGLGSGFNDADYRIAGAKIVADAGDVWQDADLIVKVKEPLGPEFDLMRENQVLFTYFHLAADEALTRKLLEKKIIGIAYETVQYDNGFLPLLAPMSEIAGRLSIQAGCAALEAKSGGKGVLLPGVAGVHPARVVIIGGGIAGHNAAHVAIGMGAQVTVLDIDIQKLRYLDDIFQTRVATVISSHSAIEEYISSADLVIGSVLIPGAKAPKLITRDMLSEMDPGSAFVDIAIDQGGCAETSRPTTHSDPTYIVDHIVHYCVTNMPGAVPRTSTLALTNATTSYVLDLANKGCEKALADDHRFMKGLNLFKGGLVCPAVAEALNIACEDVNFSH
ncbi:MAG TPA: alanine dehydrogenase [Spirochaetota bacterium]|mgnify:CR=1 FL=1|nr:alanine dehydrogenase [Spirochaetota bacterium]HPI88518.1 alanine dehydrogenase [Spirochaetota bacterium]HPR47998.1 alanine dehydrogenase [Spirochaetota bacterium]